MPTTSGRPMKQGERVRFHQEIYQKNTGPDGVTTADIIAGCEKADGLLSDEFATMSKKSPYYFRNQKGT